jgi:protein O-mannose beta-1,4-N-acetylglucosaminyltransferase
MSERRKVGLSPTLPIDADEFKYTKRKPNSRGLLLATLLFIAAIVVWVFFYGNSRPFVSKNANLELINKLEVNKVSNIDHGSDFHEEDNDKARNRTYKQLPVDDNVPYYVQEPRDTPRQLKTEWTPKSDDITPSMFMTILPSSSVWCQGTKRQDRICKFRNLCYAPKDNEWFILKTSKTVLHNVPTDRYQEGLLEISTVSNHNLFYWNFGEVDPYDERFVNVTVRMEQDTHFLFSRLHPENIMHQLHDDVIGMYHTLKEYVGKGSLKFDMPFTLDGHRILIMDDFGRKATTRVLDYLSSKPLRFFPYLQVDPNTITCFRDAVVGINKIGTWYQYGFQGFQGPIENKEVNGNHVREVADWYIRRNGLSLSKDENWFKRADTIDDREWNLTVILTRHRNRLILNEKELAAHLKARFGYEVMLISNEEYKFEEQIKYLRRARIVLGMHGSILIMGMFCRRGTILLEMFPLGVPSERYTPYKTMANLKGMDLIYKVWVVYSLSSYI